MWKGEDAQFLSWDVSDIDMKEASIFYMLWSLLTLFSTLIKLLFIYLQPLSILKVLILSFYKD